MGTIFQPIHPLSWRSLQARLTFFTLAAVLLTIWGLFTFAIQQLNHDMQATLGAQQLANVKVHAANLNQILEERVTTLEKVTRLVTPDLMGQPAKLQTLLDARPVLPALFNGGYYVTDAQGTAIASYPATAGRLGVNYSDREHVSIGLFKGQTNISKPFYGSRLQSSLLSIVTPLRDPNGEVMGVLVGVIDLGKVNFLDQIIAHDDGFTGRHALMANQWRLMVTASDKSQVLKPLPAPGQNPMLDQFLTQESGNGVMVNAQGIEVLASAQRVPLADWTLMATVPTATVFAPIDRLTRNLAWATLLASAAILVVLTLLLRRQLAPMRQTFKAITQLVDAPNNPQTLPVLPTYQDDEVGQLTNAFTKVLTRLLAREQALSTSEATLRELADELRIAQTIAKTGSWRYDVARDKLVWSDEIYRIFELDPKVFVANLANFTAMLHPEDRTAVNLAYANSLANRAPYEIEHRVLLADGRVKWVQERCHTEFDANGSPLQSVGTVQDITERKLGDLARQEATALLTTVLDAIPMRVFWKDTSLRYLGCNTVFAHDAGLQAPQDLVGRDDFAMGWAAQADLYRADDLAVMHSGQSRLNFEEPQTTPDGQTIWLRTSKIPLTTPDGHVFGVMGMYQDVTESRRYEDQLRKLSMIVEQSPESIVITDLAGNIEYVNDAFVRTSGHAREEVLGQNPRMLQSKATNQSVYQDLWQTLGQGLTWTGELINRRKNGEIYTQNAIITPIRNASGVVTHYVAVEEDITEKKKIAQELEQHRNQLEVLVAQRTQELTQARLQADAANQAKSEFLANMSHEIRTPMNGVVGSLDILEHSQLDAGQRRLLHTMHKSAMALLGILNDILDFSKIEAGKLVLEQVPTRLTEVVEDAVLLMHSLSQGRAVNLSLFIDPTLPDWVLIDPARLRQIIINLLSNALKFVPNGVGQAMVSVLPTHHPDGSTWLQIKVTDNGIGMSPQVLAQLFTPFTQADASSARHFGGTGLGLSITHRLVDLMQGQIEVQSHQGMGSEFTVTLPMLHCLAPVNAPTQAKPDLRGVQVISVAPSVHCQTVLQVYTSSAGAELLVLPNWARAREHLDTLPTLAAPDVVLLVDPTTLCNDAPDDITTRQWQSDHRVVWLLPRGGSLPTHAQPEVATGPMLCHDLLVGIAQASGRQPMPPGPDDSTGLANLPEPDVPVRLVPQGNTDKSPLLLLAEDNETNREVMQEQLRLLGYRADVAVDGAQALLKWRTGRYALLLTDCHMPRMDGYELAQSIRQAELSGQRMPIIAITASALQGEAERCKARGMDDYLSKPLRIQALSQMLAKWLPNTPSLPPAPTEQLAGSLVENAKIATESVADKSIDMWARGQFPIWNVAVLNEMIGHNQVIQRRLLGRFLTNLAQQGHSLLQAHDQQDWSAVSTVAHTLKSAARTVGAMALGDVCLKLEEAGRAANAAQLATLMGPLTDAMAQTQQRIAHHLDTTLADPGPPSPPATP